MTESIKSLATKIQITVERLIQQFAEAGIKKNNTDYVNQNEKEILLNHLNNKQNNLLNQPIKLTVQRKTRSTLNVPIIGGKSKSINIEVRKKRIYVNRVFEEIKTEELIKQKIETKQESKEEFTKNKQNIIIKNNTINKITHKTEEKEKTKQNEYQQKINKIQKNYTEKQRRTNKIESNCTIEKSFKKNKESHHYILNNTNIKLNDENYYLNSKKNISIEEENDEKEENKRSRNRITKTPNHKKKNNKLSEKTYQEEERTVSRLTSFQKGKQRKNSSLQQIFTKPITTINRNVIIDETITVGELANKMSVKSSQVIKTMINMGAMATINQIINQETAKLIAEEMGHTVILRRENELEESILSDRDINFTTLETRAPIVTIMGHVDHGKTSLLDYIRSTKVAHGESGGITQHIGAYHVQTKKGMITFLDTPGHAAFTSMRSRGAKITDIIVLVIAADDGVMPQTIEAIQHAKAAKVPIIVAINKIDKIESVQDNIKNELSKYNIISESWGGDTQFINISAKKGIGIDHLLDAIILQSEMLELKTVHKGMARGTIIESYIDKGRGPVATILVQEGTLNVGDIVLCGFEYGRIKAIRNELGKNTQSAGPSIPVEILGLSNIPSIGDEASVVRNEKKAREVALYRQGKFRDIKLARQQKYKLETIFSNIEENKIHELNIIIKTDVQGSCEAITDSLLKLSTDKIKIKIICSGVGGISETDATLATASNAIIIGFNVRADSAAKRLIENENINIRYYSIIYSLIDDIKQAMNGMLEPSYKYQIIGLAQVRNIFKSPKFNTIAGCIVTEGVIKRNNSIRILRNNIVIYEGEIESLRRFKDDVNEVNNGIECGIAIKNYNDMHINDIIEVFKLIEIKHSINN
ncbi:Translation initiation factor IF-2 [Candidatus Providencia siddallii]|uniref:Translation initiation factor IF-2 n=1 Tax=Candidatus Providencia siddallii TaxID=1715285 RepID=A0A0M6W9E7_9GAMM|nr:Translation initiation factor IF-2 [Candidatus Providencia siddallii]